MKPPISDPFSPPVSETNSVETKVFKHSLWRIFVGVLPISIAFLPAILFLMWRVKSRGMPSQGEGGIFIMGIFLFVFYAFLLASVAALAASLAPLKVNRFGVQLAPLRGSDEWSKIKSARYFWFGLPYVRITMEGQWFKVWVPLTLRDRKGFALAVQEWAPDDNPLRLFLQKRGF